MRKLWIILFLGCVIGLSSNVYAGPSNIGTMIINHRVYENGTEINKLYFSLLNESGDPAVYDVESIELKNPGGVEVATSVEKFYDQKYLSGRYLSETGQWSYDQDFTYDPGYIYVFEGTLTPGTYSLNVVIDGLVFSKELVYNGTHEVPIISSKSFQKQYDENGNLFLRWKPPLYSESGLATSVRIYLDIYTDDTNTDQFLYVTVPSHLNSLFVPNEIIEILRTKGNKFYVSMHVRTNDNNNRSYTNQIVLDQIPDFCDYDVNNDGKTGPVEAVHALRIAAGIINP